MEFVGRAKTSSPCFRVKNKNGLGGGEKAKYAACAVASYMGVFTGGVKRGFKVRF
jgi:hypothetical protein